MLSVSRLSLVFSCVGHAYIHMFTAFFFVIVLALEQDWQQPYHELVPLWTLGALLVGVAALPAGWLGDRWSARGMMCVFYLGMGGCSILAGLSSSTSGMLWALAGIGLFAAIYHPVGIPWLVRNTPVHRGKILALNGVFGSIGAALAGLIAGGLIDLGGWRVAFIVPGTVSVLTGLLLCLFVASGRMNVTPRATQEEPARERGDLARVFLILMFTMFVAGVIYHTTQAALPKLFAERGAGLGGIGATRIGASVALVYTVAGCMQFVGGYLADRYPLKIVYIGSLFLQIPFLWLAASLSGAWLVVAVTAMVTAGVSALPAENLLLARYAPAHHHGIAFGAKFVLYFAAAPLAVQMVAVLYQRTGGFYWAFLILAFGAACISVAAVMLPRPPRMEPVVAAA